MERKPISPEQHSLLDYVFSAVQMVGPKAMGLNKETTTTYQVLGTGFLGVNALTDTPLGVKRVLSMKDHQKADAGFLAGLSLLTFAGPIRKNKKELCFHLGFLSLAVATYCLTDYESENRR